MKYFIQIILLSSSLTACNSKKTLFEKLSSSQTNITFNNKISISDSLNVLKFEYIYNGAGVGVGDVNGDGFSDVFFAGNQVSSKLYLNKGNKDGASLQFEDITLPAHVGTQLWCTGVAIVDVNQDGKLDIFVSTISPKIDKSAPKLLFINQGNNADGVPIFKESAKEIGLADESYGTQAAFLDYDLDGDLDVYLLTNAIEAYNRNNNPGQKQDGTGRSVDKFYRNEGNNQAGLPIFKDISKEAGILAEGWGLGIIVNDFNRDGYPDVYVGNDFLSNDLLYINNKNGTFTNKIDEYLTHQSHNSMGMDMADINNDELNDLIVVDMLPDNNVRQKAMFGNIEYDKFQENLRRKYQPQYVRNVLQLNNGNNSFSDIGYMAGIAATDWSWSPLMADFDNDGLRDILITNGYRLDVTDLDFIVYRGDDEVFGNQKDRAKKMQAAFSKLEGVKKPNFLYKNKGNLGFENVAEQFGLDAKSYTNGTAYADLDNDGDLDLVMNNIDDEAFVYRNTLNDKKETKNNHFLRIKLEGNKPNWEGFGAKVTLYYQGKTQFAEHETIRGFKSTVENFIHFGLGQNNINDSLKITWQSGNQQVIKNIVVDKVLFISEKNASPPTLKSIKTETYTFEEVSKKYNINFISEENDYNDFLIQHTLPHKHSELGSGIAVGDVNGDGLDGFFVGGSAHKKGAFFLQTKFNSFTKREFVEKDEEDMGILLIDVDNDKDLDLYCVSGSSEFTVNYNRYQDRIYKNDGKGNFSLTINILPPIKSSGSSVNACDFDKDGDLDLFRGGRVRSTEYPLTPESYLLENTVNNRIIKNALFKDITPDELKNIGMVTSALWTDYDNDSWMDLMLVGEFMPITIFKNNNGKSFEKIKVPSLQNTNGWWNSLAGGDFDNDGDIDYALGNLGLNSKLKASINQPVTVCAKDFDDNGTMDALLTAYNGNKEYLIHPRGILIDQMIAMRRRFKSFKEYGETTFSETIPEIDLKGSIMIKSQLFANSYLENKGKGKFKIRTLPIENQTSPMYGIIVKDINQDGNLDILTVGNDYSTEVLTGRYDAGIGNYLQGDGKGNFKNVSVTKSNFFVKGNSKALAEIYLKDGTSLLLTSQINDKMLAFKQTDNVLMKKNPKRKEEFYIGSGYLSQSGLMRSRKLSF